MAAFEDMGAENSDVFDDLGAQIWIAVRHLWYPSPSRVFGQSLVGKRLKSGKRLTLAPDFGVTARSGG